MRVYEDDTDSFSQEYLDYLKTLTSEVFEGSVRITRNSLGEIVNLEIWHKEDPHKVLRFFVSCVSSPAYNNGVRF